MSTIICIGDPHFQTSNIPEVEVFMARLDAWLSTVCPALIVMLGDLLHTHENLHVDPLNKACEFIKMLSRHATTYAIVGNHDMISNNQFLTGYHWLNVFKGWENVTVVDEVKHLELHGEKLVFCPYVQPGRFQEALSTGPEWRDAARIFAHQEFKGCKMGAIVSEIGDEWSSELPPVVSGHIHSNQRVGNVYYPGSALQHAFGESDKAIIACVHQTGEITEHDMGLPRKRIEYTTVAEVQARPVAPTDGSVKLSMTGTTAEIKAFKKTNTFKSLGEAGYRMAFKAKQHLEMDEEVDVGDFQMLLRGRVLQSEDAELFAVYRTVFEGGVDDEEYLVL